MIKDWLSYTIAYLFGYFLSYFYIKDNDKK